MNENIRNDHTHYSTYQVRFDVKKKDFLEYLLKRKKKKTKRDTTRQQRLRYRSAFKLIKLVFNLIRLPPSAVLSSRKMQSP